MWRGWGSTSRDPLASPCPSLREKADWVSRWACGGQKGGEREERGEEVRGVETGWDSLAGAGGFRVKVNSEPGVPLGDWGRPVAQGENTGIQGIGLWLRLKVMTRERTKRKREEETKENRNIRRFQKPSAVISMTKKKTVAANVVHIRTCTYVCTTVLISLTANFVNNLLFMTKVRQYL